MSYIAASIFAEEGAVWSHKGDEIPVDYRPDEETLLALRASSDAARRIVEGRVKPGKKAKELIAERRANVDLHTSSLSRQTKTFVWP
ncbi:hypothetical protein LAWI1_G007224 [Lachnellula willkommii]|uniref:Uncharacterized protein n=1 Tax=Lachnellula willkommii TaxID=215461 RepID=A0A559M277_9HELO|nr:hypothetical protein LAWI1_G007224 [Lachnellula willkommii]